MTGPFRGSAEELELLAQRAAELAAEEETDTEERISALVVVVDEELYALPVESVREVVSEYRLTPVPCAPASVRGVINLRGEIVSVTDLGVAMGVRAQTAARLSPLVIVGDGSVTTALLVDTVADIATVAASEIDASAAGARPGARGFRDRLVRYR